MAILHTSCNDLIDDPILIHEKSFMMHIYDPLIHELPEFKDYMDYQYEYLTSHYAASSKTREVPLKKLLKELLNPTDRDNQEITNVPEKIGVIGIRELLDE